MKGKDEMNGYDEETLSAIRRWVISATQPGLSVTAMAKCEAGLRHFVEKSPQIARFYFAGILWGIGLTLPPEDGWRLMSARLGDVTVGDRPPADESAVTVLGHPFGTAFDGSDICLQQNPDATQDVGRAALADGLCPRSAALLAIGLRANRNETVHSLESVNVDELADIALPAVRWVLWRRQAYPSYETDMYPYDMMNEWIGRAARLARGEAIDDENIRQRIDMELIPPGAYTEIRTNNTLGEYE